LTVSFSCDLVVQKFDLKLAWLFWRRPAWWSGRKRFPAKKPALDCAGFRERRGIA